ncbi:MAG: hypothetical protein IKZ51_03625 [Bacteroidales bacterium]|nr:hypothetical protein [Bacteroidales bacterium]
MRALRLTNTITALVAILLCAACHPDKKITPDTLVKSGDWKEVPSYGGTIEKDDITIDFPSGTFGGDTKVAISDVKKGSVLGEFEISPFYQVTLDPKGTKNSFEIRILYSGNAQDVQAVAKMAGYDVHSDKLLSEAIPVPFKVKDGYVSVTVPKVSESKDGNPFLTIGLAKNTGRPSTKTANTEIGILNIYSEDINDVIFDQATKALDLLASYKFNTNFPYLQLVVSPILDSETLAAARVNPVCKDWGWIALNATELKALMASKLEKTKLQDFQQTLVHESFHVIHNIFYDTRSGNDIMWEGSVGNEWTMLGEAIGTWTEKLTGNKKMGDNASKNAYLLLNEFMPINNTCEAYKDHGYGMSLFIDYLSKKTSDKKIVTLIESQLDGAESLKDAFDIFLKRNGLTFFDATSYMQFVKAILNGEIHEDVSQLKSQFGTGHNVNSVSALKIKENVYNFGTRINRININKTSVVPKLNDKEIKFTQDGEHILTYVYYINESTGKLVELGKFTKDNPYSIAAESLLKVSPQQPIILVSIIKDPVYKTEESKASGITMDFVAPDKNVPKIQEVTFSMRIALDCETGGGDTEIPDVTWSKSYDNIIKVTKNGAGLDITCDNSSNNFSTYTTTSITFHVDSYSAGKMGAISSLDFKYSNNRGSGESVWHLALDSMPLIENEVSVFNSSEALWKATNSEMKGKFGHTDQYGNKYKYVSKSSNYAKLYMEYK